MNNAGVILLIIATTALSLRAEKGDTMAQSLIRYGSPTGVLKSGSTAILTFETSSKKITETYNSVGVCTTSVVELKPALRPIIYAPQITSKQSPRKSIQTTSYANKRSQSNTTKLLSQTKKATKSTPSSAIYIPQIDLKSRDSLQSDLKTSEATKPKKNDARYHLKLIIPFSLLIIAISIGLGWFIVRRKRKRTDSEATASDTRDNIESFCQFVQRKGRRNRTTLAPQDPDKEFYKNA